MLQKCLGEVDMKPFTLE